MREDECPRLGNGRDHHAIHVLAGVVCLQQAERARRNIFAVDGIPLVNRAVSAFVDGNLVGQRCIARSVQSIGRGRPTAVQYPLHAVGVERGRVRVIAISHAIVDQHVHARRCGHRYVQAIAAVVAIVIAGHDVLGTGQVSRYGQVVGGIVNIAVSRSTNAGAELPNVPAV